MSGITNRELARGYRQIRDVLTSDSDARHKEDTTAKRVSEAITKCRENIKRHYEKNKTLDRLDVYGLGEGSQAREIVTEILETSVDKAYEAACHKVGEGQPRTCLQGIEDSGYIEDTDLTEEEERFFELSERHDEKE